MRFDVKDIKQAYQALLVLHTFIGCDTADTKYLSEAEHSDLWVFVCDLYGHKEDITGAVNTSCTLWDKEGWKQAVYPHVLTAWVYMETGIAAKLTSGESVQKAILTYHLPLA